MAEFERVHLNHLLLGSIFCSAVSAKNGSSSKSSTVGTSAMRGGERTQSEAGSVTEHKDSGSHDIASSKHECSACGNAVGTGKPDAPWALKMEPSMMRMWGDVQDGKWLSCMAGEAMM